MKKKFVSMIISACMLMGAMPMSTLAAEPQVVDLIHSSGTTLRDGIAVSSFRVKNSGTAEAPVRQELVNDYNTSYGAMTKAFDGSISGTKNQAIIDYAYEVYFQVDLGASREISQIVYTVKCNAETSITRNNDKQNFMITLSNDSEFKDNPSDPLDVYVAYYEGDENSADPQNVHTANLSDIPSYRYIRISAPNNGFMEGEPRELCIAELEVYGYIDGGANITEGATAVTNDSKLKEYNLNAKCIPSSVTVSFNSYFSSSNVTVSGKKNTSDAYTTLATASSLGRGTHSISIPEGVEEYQYIKVESNSGSFSGDVVVYGYNLFDEVAYLDITDDNTTVYAKAKYGDENTLILAEYDSNGRCMQVKSAKATEIITMPVVEGRTYKAFLWKSLKERIPVTKSIKLEK